MNKNFNVDMFSANIRGGKAFAKEKKIGELKKIISKHIGRCYTSDRWLEQDKTWKIWFRAKWNRKKKGYI